MMKTVLFAAAAALATAMTAAPVLAKDVVVRYGDLDLASAKGQATFARRIDHAAKAACFVDSDPRVLNPASNACYRQAKAKAKTQMAALVEDTRLGG